jgi:glycosyltransferase involved in cell wall biosynthesis
VKIAFVLPGGVDRSGDQRVIPCLLWLVERLVAAGDELHIFALNQEPRPGRWPLLGAIVHNAGSRPRQLRAFAALAAEHRRAPFDVVHGFWATGPGVVSAAFARLAGVPAVLTVPGSELTALPEIGYGGQLTLTGRFWTRIALAGADRVIVESDWVAKRAARFGVTPAHLPFGVALDRWPLLAPRRREPGAPLRLIHVANINPVKDHETLLLALRELDRRGIAYSLDAIGLDTMGGAVQRRCAELGLAGRVTFQGVMTHAGQRPWFEAADLLVVSSRHEGAPLVAQEAGVAGVPAVGTAVGHIADWAPEAAVAVPVGDWAALATAIADLAIDEEKRLRLAHAAQKAASRVDADLTARTLRALYIDLRRSDPRRTR